jgi:predicted DNA-binding transcriptional regulator
MRDWDIWMVSEDKETVIIPPMTISAETPYQSKLTFIKRLRDRGLIKEDISSSGLLPYIKSHDRSSKSIRIIPRDIKETLKSLESISNES